jgi:hypothetical protein
VTGIGDKCQDSSTGRVATRPDRKTHAGFFAKKEDFPLTKPLAAINFSGDFGLMNSNLNPQSGGLY